MDNKLSPQVLDTLAQDVVSLEDCFKVYELDDFGSRLDKNSIGWKHLLDVVLTRCREDPLALFAVWLDTTLPLYPDICDAVFKDLLTRYSTLEGLYMLYRVIPFEVEPYVDEDWHRLIVEEMIKVCGKDLKKLSTMLRMFDKIPDFTEMIQEAMSKAAE